MGKARKRKKHRTKAQHYVAQFYLNGFTNSNGLMFCYDKAANKSYSTKPKGAAQEANFYEIVRGTTEEPVPDNMVEKALGKIETIGAKQLRDLIAYADDGKIPHELLEHFCSYIASGRSRILYCDSMDAYQNSPRYDVRDDEEERSDDCG